MRKKLILIALSLLALVALLGLWGMTLPREHRVASRVTIAAPPESVYNVMRDVGKSPAWWKDLQSATAVPGTDGWERWKEAMGGNSFTLIISDEEPSVRFITTIDTTGGSAFGGEWTHEVAMAPGGSSTVTITESGWVSNPYFRVMMKVGGPYSSLDSYLIALGTRFGQTVTPAHVAP
jgi:uncharacterized protein YndB with AHSA1/START domain